MPKKQTTDDVIRRAIKLGVREDHAKAAITKQTTDEGVEAYKGFVEALEQVADEHASRR